ncbi:hypothetical protein [Streptomyces sp. NPDC059874]|uniref:hypothetical protein n=1 Tax=Streptomyces sp. NPDC059874 TaxID=3346983 RepID=UPI00365F6708
MILDAALADLLRDQGSSETGMERVLAALIDQGVFVPVHHDGSLHHLPHRENDAPAVLACVSEACCAEHLPEAAGTVRCDAVRLMDIARETGAEQLLLFASDGASVVIPFPSLFRAMARRGQQGNGQRLKLTWSTHPLAVALRDAAFRRLREFPAIDCVWVSHVRWLDTGNEHLMVHMAVNEELPSPESQRFVETLLDEELTIGADDPMISALALHRVTHAAQIADLDRMGLDTIRIDHSTGRIELISQEYNDPEAAAAARRAHAEQQQERHDARPPRRWWRRS